MIDRIFLNAFVSLEKPTKYIYVRWPLHGLRGRSELFNKP